MQATPLSGYSAGALRSRLAIFPFVQKREPARPRAMRTGAGNRARVSLRKLTSLMTQDVLPGRSQKCATKGNPAIAATIGREQGLRPLRV